MRFGVQGEIRACERDWKRKGVVDSFKGVFLFVSKLFSFHGVVCDSFSFPQSSCCLE